METPTHILLVDDDTELTAMLTRYLASHGFNVDSVIDGRGMESAIAARLPDVVLLDLMLPGDDGLTLARRLKERYPSLPVLMLSARGDTVDRVLGLEMGADDYLAKPFDPRELLARIRAVLRRAAPTPNTPEVFTFGDFRLDMNAHMLTRHGRPMVLTTGELTLLHLFLRNRGRVLTRDQLVQLVQGEERLPFERGIDVRVARIRKKIEDNILEPRWIRTVWGVGYLFAAED